MSSPPARAVAVARRPDVLCVVGLCAAGIALRAPGLTSADLWFDDAWAALPAHVSFTTALHMVVAAPLYALALRAWIEVGPAATWWDQLPAFILGIAGIAAVYALVRSLRFSRLAAFVAGAAIAAGPITVAYSARLKEYPSDLLFACLLLWLAERWRRAPTMRATVALALAGVASLWVSASTAPVVGGAAAVVVVTGVSRPAARRDATALVGTLAIGSIGVWFAFLRRVPSQLRTNWRTHGYLFGYSSTHHVLYDVQQTFSGLAHGLFGIPVPWTASSSSIGVIPMATAVVTVAGLAALVVAPVVTVVRRHARELPASFAAATTVALAVAGTLVGVAPLGDGRTDEAIYPALLVLVVAAATAIATRTAASARLRDGARVATVGIVGVTAVLFGAAHVAEYPPTGLDTVVAELHHALRPGELVVVDGYESFTWADDDLSPWHVSFTQGTVPWPMGFHVVSDRPTYVLSGEYLQPDAQTDALSSRTTRLWYVGPTIGGYSTAAPHSWWILPDPTPLLTELTTHGWHGAGVCCHAPGVFAELLVYRSG